MSYTIIVDPEQQARDVENRLNTFFRRCRVGKVTIKFQGYPVGHPFEDIMKPRPIYPTTPSLYFPKQDLPDVCQQCAGKICGNVACPSRMTVTCAA